jgi:nucleoid DNA-binding protein
MDYKVIAKKIYRLLGETLAPFIDLSTAKRIELEVFIDHFIENFFTELKYQILKGNKVKIKGFGVFNAKYVEETSGKLPNGKIWTKKAHKVITFKEEITP